MSINVISAANSNAVRPSAPLVPRTATAARADSVSPGIQPVVVFLQPFRSM